MNIKIIPVNLGFVKSFLVKGNKTIIVDTGIPGSHNKILDVMKQNDISPNDVSLIVITHAHTDHYGSIAELKNITGAKIAIHRDDADFFIKGINQSMLPHGFIAKIMLYLIRFISKYQKPLQTPKPDLIINDQFSLTEFGLEGIIIHTPGHTQGSISLVIDKKVIIGDNLIGKGKPKLAQFADDISIVKKSLDKILSFNPEYIYVSHGDCFTADQVKKTFVINDYIKI